MDTDQLVSLILAFGLGVFIVFVSAVLMLLAALFKILDLGRHLPSDA